MFGEGCYAGFGKGEIVLKRGPQKRSDNISGVRFAVGALGGGEEEEFSLGEVLEDAGSPHTGYWGTASRLRREKRLFGRDGATLSGEFLVTTVLLEMSVRGFRLTETRRTPEERTAGILRTDTFDKTLRPCRSLRERPFSLPVEGPHEHTLPNPLERDGGGPVLGSGVELNRHSFIKAGKGTVWHGPENHKL